MQALQFTLTGSLDTLRLVELPTPTPAAGEVLVEVRAAGLNPSDVKNVLGRFPYTTVPRIPGRDFAGVVVAGPEELLGQSVWGGTGKGFGFNRDGCHAQFVALPANAVARKPESLSFAQAATCGVPFITAWDALERSDVTAGTRLLILGAGAVARAAQGLATARGANVAIGARRDEVVAELSAAGISAFAIQDADTLPEQTQQMLHQPPEVIFDTTGFWLEAAVNTLAPFGRIAVIAAPVDGMVNTPILNLYRRGGSIVGINSLLYSLEDSARMLGQIGAYFDKGVLPLPTGFRELPLAEGAAAYEAVNSGSVEKLVLMP